MGIERKSEIKDKSQIERKIWNWKKNLKLTQIENWKQNMKFKR